MDSLCPAPLRSLGAQSGGQMSWAAQAAQDAQAATWVCSFRSSERLGMFCEPCPTITNGRIPGRNLQPVIAGLSGRQAAGGRRPAVLELGILRWGAGRAGAAGWPRAGSALLPAETRREQGAREGQRPARASQKAPYSTWGPGVSSPHSAPGWARDQEGHSVGTVGDCRRPSRALGPD